MKYLFIFLIILLAFLYVGLSYYYSEKHAFLEDNIKSNELYLYNSDLLNSKIDTVKILDIKDGYVNYLSNYKDTTSFKTKKLCTFISCIEYND